MVVVDIALALLQDLDKHVFQVRFDRLDGDQRQMLCAELGEQVIEPVLVGDGAAYATSAIFGRDREAVQPWCGRYQRSGGCNGAWARGTVALGESPLRRQKWSRFCPRGSTG